MEEKDIRVQELKEDELSKVAGGNAKDEAESENAWLQDTYCHGEIEQGEHQWVKSGSHREDPYFIFLTKTVYEHYCAKCGRTKWVAD